MFIPITITVISTIIIIVTIITIRCSATVHGDLTDLCSEPESFRTDRQ